MTLENAQRLAGLLTGENPTMIDTTIEVPTDPIIWTLEQAVKVARKFEAAAIPAGFHIALGGSVLHSGQSTKDLDIFIYPHKAIFARRSLRLAKNALSEIGVTWCKFAASHHDDEKVVIAGSFEGKRIDFFFVQ